MDFDLPDVYKISPEKKGDVRHPLQPQKHFRAVVLGSAGQGKTTQVVNFLIPSGKNGSFWPYQKLYIFSPTIDQDKFQILKGIVEKMEIEIYKQTGKKFKIWHASDNIADISTIEERLDPAFLSTVIFDDYLGNNTVMKVASDLFVRGRHKNANVAFLSQDFYNLPAQMRKNANIFVLFPGLTPRNVSSIAQDIPLSFTTKEFKKIYNTIVNDDKIDHPYLYIDLTTSDRRYMIRQTAVYPKLISGFNLDITEKLEESDEESEEEIDEEEPEIKDLKLKPQASQQSQSTKLPSKPDVSSLSIQEFIKSLKKPKST